MRLLKRLLLVAAVSMATPVWAHDAHGHGHDGPRHVWNGHRQHFDGRHHGYYAYRPRVPYVYVPYYASGYYYPPYPPYGYAVAAPGIQVVVPNIYIPLR
jgi:hypothetical protein